MIAIVCVAAGSGARVLLDPIARGHIPVIAFYPFVLLACLWGGALSGLSAIALSAFIAYLLWVPHAGASITLTAFFCVSLFGLLMVRLLRALVWLHVEGEQRALLMAHEINHRANNLLMVVQAISAQTARNATSVDDYQSIFSKRIKALARAQQLLATNPEQPPDFGAFLAHIIEPFGVDRFSLDGPVCSMPQSLAQSCALLLHELSTNATKYGALSVPEGRVEIRWEMQSDGIHLYWREVHGPVVSAPVRAGFGSRLLRTLFPPKPGEALIDYDPAGVRCRVVLAA